ncbi:hypothetical protein BASA50_003832 [Batrachochytrium salamandrivorans]|uniref:Uncharacterized protein n=1 Tax=Batrachochytrium salamandrivorans TaxID=1357716 RepID=A0ABQ8FH52_9FUNG|nr:hypothetical protein BASA60_003425 [Batrachochytrium salamandrivorans]KAH6598217.1 hypothetical protein BASA50_003832 [Batrachochytrium salamandrivorans]KAH9276000.1 hypothetical protein BASA83_001272 [Batrachochytrium salamandrivorans]
MANTPVASAIGHDKYSSLGLNNTNDNNISISTSSGLRLAISRSGTRPEMRPFFRLIILFALGSLLSLLVDSLQQSHRITRWPRASNTDPSGLGTNAVANSFGSSSTGSSSSKSDGSGSSYSSNSGSNPTTSANSGYIALVESAWRGGAGSPFSSAGWVPLSCGLAACLMGTLYPLLDQWLLSKQQAITIRRDWSSALRSILSFYIRKQKEQQVLLANLP